MWKCFSPTKVVYIKKILESIYLHWDISMIHYANAILELVLIFCTFQELHDILTLCRGEVYIILDRYSILLYWHWPYGFAMLCLIYVK